MHFQAKNTLKNNCYHNTKHALYEKYVRIIMQKEYRLVLRKQL